MNDALSIKMNGCTDLHIFKHDSLITNYYHNEMILSHLCHFHDDIDSKFIFIGDTAKIPTVVKLSLNLYQMT